MLITGSWFGFQHPNKAEGIYWNPDFQKFSAAQWRALIADMAGIGMEYLVMMGSASDSKTFYPSKHFNSFEMGDPDPMETVFCAADDFNLKIFVSNDFYADSADCGNLIKMFQDKEISHLREIAMAEIAEKYGHHSSFYGWYWPNELDIFPYFNESFIKYVNANKRFADTLLTGRKTLIAPFGTFHLCTDDHFCRQLDSLDVDFVAYQDEIGVRKANVDWTPYFFERLKKAHDKVGRAHLWADVEIFDFDGQVYTTPLHPAPMDRVFCQIEGITPFVERILIFQYTGLMSRPGTTATIKTPGATSSYLAYDAYRQTYLEKQK